MSFAMGALLAGVFINRQVGGKHLRREGIEVVLVGGACVSLHTQNQYQTLDLADISGTNLRNFICAPRTDAGGEPRVGAAVLADRARHSGQAGAAGVGRQGDRSAGQDLRSAFPDMKGFSPRNLKYMRAFAEAWPDSEFVQQVAAQLPWGHNAVLLDRLDSPESRRWYAAKAIENSWSRNVLVRSAKSSPPW